MLDRIKPDRGHVDRAVFGMWIRIDDSLMTETIGAALVDELRRELPPDSPLSDADVRPLYMCVRCDDTVFAVFPDRFARVHLTWDQKRSREPLPFTDIFDTREALLASMRGRCCKSPEQATTPQLA